LEKRKRSSKLSQTEKQYLRKLGADNPQHMHTIMLKYKLSYSTYHRITQRPQQGQSIIENEENFETNKLTLNDFEERAIKIIVSPPAIPLTIGRIQHAVAEASGRKHKKRTIKQFLKNKLNYSYRKGSSRPIKSSSIKSTIIKGLY
jgi:hypothetical protein